MDFKTLIKYITFSLKSEGKQYKSGAKKMGKTKMASLLAIVILGINSLLSANGLDGNAAAEYLSDKTEGILLILVLFGVLKDDQDT